MKRIKELTELLFVIALVISCHAVRKSQQVKGPDFDKQGHRGSRGLMPENTVPAMLKAVDLGVTTLEMDAVITSDNKVILSHEPFFNHDITTGPDGKTITAAEEKNLNIYKMTFRETQTYDVGLKPHPRFPEQQKLKSTKPLLNDLIEDVEAYVKLKGDLKMFYNIETKSSPATDNIFHPAPEEFVDLIMKVVHNRRIDSRVIIQSFDFRTLKIVHDKYPGIRTAALIENADKETVEQHIQKLGFTPSIYSPHYALVSPALIAKCHEQKMKIIPWTVNDKPTIERLKEWGVDGIITDFPNLF